MCADFFSVTAYSETQNNKVIADCAHRILGQALSDFFIPTSYHAVLGSLTAPSYEISKPLLWENGSETVTKNGVETAAEGLILGRSQSPDVRSEIFRFFDHALAEDDLFVLSCHGLVHLYDGVSGKNWYDYEKRQGGYEAILNIEFCRNEIGIPLFGGTSHIEFSSESAVWMPRGRVYDSPPPDEYRDYNAGVATYNVIELAKCIAKAGDSYQDFADESYLRMAKRRIWGAENTDIVAAILYTMNPKIEES